HQLRVQSPGRAHQLLRGDGLEGRLRGVGAQGLAGDGVLAVGTMEIAPEHPERQRVRAGIDMEERLLLDRVALNASDVAKWDAQLAALVEAHAATAVSRSEE